MKHSHQQLPEVEDGEDLNTLRTTISHDQIDQNVTASIKKIKKHKKAITSRYWKRWRVCLFFTFFIAIITLQYFYPIDVINSCKMLITEEDIKEGMKEGIKEGIQEGQSDFIFNKQVWIYQPPNPNYLQTLKLENIKRFAGMSNFVVNFITKENYKTFLSIEGSQKLDSIINILRQRQDTDKSNLKIHFVSIEKLLTSLFILNQKGGVMLHHSVTLTENFDWIRTIRTNVYVNRGNPRAKPRVVGFFSPFYSSNPLKQRKEQHPGMQQVEQYMVLFPTIQNYFIAAEQKSEFITKIIEQAIDILTNPDQIARDISRNKYQYIHVDKTDVYYQYFMHACHRVLKDKQVQLDKSSQGLVTRSFAIDYYGLNLLNCYYGPYKLHVNLRYVFHWKQIQSFARLDLQQFQANVGRMRYIEITTIPGELDNFLTRLNTGNQSEKGIMKGSFIQKMYFPNANESFIYPNPQKSFVNESALAWTKLPKVIWFYWDSGLTDIRTTPCEIVIFVQNLKEKALASGFLLKEVNSSNVMDYLSAEILATIDHALTKGKRQVFIQTKSDLYRLAFLYKYGGIYLDSSMIPLENFDWLVNIARFPSKYVYNRYGEVPQVFLFWDQNFGGLFEWEVSQAYQTKTDWRFSIQNSFIAANKESEFIKEWLDWLLQLLMMPMDEIFKLFEEYQITKFKWTTEDSYYLLSMDAAKLVFGRREKKIRQELAANDTKVVKWEGSMDYYKIWSMNCLLGFFKLRAFTNYDNQDRRGLNYYLTRFSQEYAEGILGKFNFIIKIIGEDRPAISGFMIDNSGNMQKESHSQSIFRKYLYNQKYTKFKVINQTRVIKLD